MFWTFWRLHTFGRVLYTMSEQVRSKFVLRCGSFNVLAPCYNWISGWWGRCESAYPNLYLPRCQSIIDLISSQNPSLDILCLQEFWFQDDVLELFESQLEKQYRMVKLKRTGLKTDGVAILIDRSISILAICSIPLSFINQRVALLVHLLLPCNEEVLLMTTHLTYCSNFIHKYVRMSQIKTAIHEIENFKIKNCLSHVPVILAGDFNGSQEDPVYKFIVENGFLSSYKTIHNREPQVTHRLYSGNHVTVDYIFHRNSSPLHLVPRRSAVLPLGYKDEDWPKEYSLSDHRMIVTEFDLEKQDL